MHITIGAPAPGLAWLQQPGDGQAPPQGALAAGQLMNQRLAVVGDSRAAATNGPRQYTPGASSKLFNVGDYEHYSYAALDLNELNGVGSPFDRFGEALASDCGVLLIIGGYNEPVTAQTSAVQIMNRMNAVKVAVTGESGTFARDSSGTYENWGDACADGAGGTGVVTHQTPGFIWLAQPDGLASGDTITCANSGYSATLAEDPPAHSRRLVLWASEFPANYYVHAGDGPHHLAFHEWLETDPFDGLDLIHCRTIEAMSILADTPNPPDQPLPWLPGFSPDGVHFPGEGSMVVCAHLARQIDALLANYDRQDARQGLAPAGVTDLSADVAFTGSKSVANGVVPSAVYAWGGDSATSTISLVGADGDPDREIQLAFNSGTGAASTTSPETYHAMQFTPAWVDPGQDVYIRMAVDVLVSNTAGDGPPVGLDAFYYTNRLFIQTPTGAAKESNVYLGKLGHTEWRRLMLPDLLVPAGSGGSYQMRLYSYYDAGVPIDVLFRWRRPGVWIIPA